jgi:transcriptional regulator with XRE-family HTH domain
MLGEKIKALREEKGLVQRELAAHLEVDTAFISKVEKGEKRLSKSHVEILSKVFSTPKKELVSLWLADKVISVLSKEKNAESAISLVQNHYKKNKK